MILLALTMGPTGDPSAPAQLAAKLMRMWETGDTSALEGITAPDVVYDDIPNGEQYRGRAGVADYIGHVHSWASDISIEVLRLHAGPDFAVAEWRMRGVQDRPIGGHIPVTTDRRFELKGLTLVETRDGRIHRAADYIDVLGFVLQLGAHVTLPGGATLPPKPQE